MELSLQELEICRFKTGSSPFCGLADIQTYSGTISQKESSQIFDNLLENDLITVVNDEIHVSALGQFFVKMMTHPELMISIENHVTHVKINIYIRDAYYLSVLDKEYERSPKGSKTLFVDLQPTLKEVVGAFVYGIVPETDQKLTEIESANTKDHDIHIMGITLDKQRNIDSQMDIRGDYHGRRINYSYQEKTGTTIQKTDVADCQFSSLVNTLTGWLFDKLSTLEERREDHYGENES
ncbi:MAG: hypothetical protein IKF22_01895 [Lachnospiraceae bacterium]|nr:hypothetical protein [Lachnospiraceae bacterium]